MQIEDKQITAYRVGDEYLITISKKGKDDTKIHGKNLDDATIRLTNELLLDLYSNVKDE